VKLPIDPRAPVARPGSTLEAKFVAIGSIFVPSEIKLDHRYPPCFTAFLI